MSFLASRFAVLLVSLLATGSGAAQASGSPSFPPPPPPPPSEEATGFTALRKPPVPVSFLTHEGGWIAFNYPPSARDRLAPLIAEADDWRGELAETLGQTPLDGIEVRIARGPQEMATLAPLGALMEPDSSGAAFPQMKLIVLSLGTTAPASAADLAAAFRRELARAALDEAVGGRPLPAWFAEGFAAQFAREGDWRLWTLYGAAMRDRTVSIAALDIAAAGRGSGQKLAVAQAADFVRFLARPERQVKLAATLDLIRQGRDYEAALLRAYQTPFPTLERAWRDDLQRRAVVASVGLFTGVPALCGLVWVALRALARRRARAASALARSGRGPAGKGDARRVHIVFSRRDDRAEPIPAIPEAEIPKVEHDGEWHTLH